MLDLGLGPNVLQAPISFSGSGDNTVVAAASGKLIRVLSLFWVNATATVITFKSGATAITGPMNFLANGSFYMDYIRLPLNCEFEEAFIMNSTVASQVGGTIWYVKADRP